MNELKILTAVGHAICLEETINTYKIMAEKHHGKYHLDET
jgi:hypothetical protein